ncbi:phosphoribosylglycinamide formyltransferase-1 [Erythromicrobium ramosum]|uniref:Phosphoribosylglycinamide formyltransferase n=1 Tax=Erythrobacter ramosus TaxID=35811 RepID=A0A6I4UL82_9SPHN|nr:phosphoribosylglycinamide formyltransferase [Erythrobacter ramosus]MBB3775523.1 phosphoribosylglycinamide formyltransferase-1 [Erythrobacter ramosus]MXP39378.1 phosphoribosylglycinamide formyltransferase [Erythrobacter ramosus]
MTDKAKIAVLISGAGTNMAALVYASRIGDCPYEVVLVASNDAQAPGLALAAAEGIATFAHPHKGMTREAHDAAMEDAVRQAGADYIVLAGYMRILSDDFVERWQGRMLNIHPSLLPLYKGLDTHARAIAAGDSHGGTSVHLVTPELDAGEVLAQVRVPIVTGDTPHSLAERVKLAEHQLYPRAVAEYVSRWRNPAWLLERLRERALALPETSEQESFGSAGFRVGEGKSGKYFAYFSDRPHGHERIALLVKTSGMDELNALVEDQPETYFKPAFYGASGWVGIILDRPDLDWGDVEAWLQRSWRSVAPKRLTRMLDIADEF